MPCFAKANPIDKNSLSAKPSTSSTNKTNTKDKYDSRNIMECKRKMENPNFDTRNIPAPVRDTCIDVMETRGFTADVHRRYLTRPAPPKQQDSKRPKQPKFILQKDIDRLRHFAKVETLAEKLEKTRAEESYNIKMNEIATKTKERFKAMDEARWQMIANSGGVDGDPKIEERNRVLDRSFVIRYEQDPEVKEVSRIIMSTKVAAIRDAQLLEKAIIEQKLKDEKLRFEKQVVANSAIDFLAEEQKDKAKKAEYRAGLTAQVKEREYLRFVESRRLEEEARQLHLAQEALKKLEEEEKIMARERRKRLMDEYNQILEMSNLFKKMLCEQEQESEMRVAAYLKEKRIREQKLAEEKNLLNEAAERRRNTIFMLGQKILQAKTQRNEMSLLREQERAEREYRRKEKEAAIKKKQYEKELAENREKQQLESKRHRALQIARAEEDFNAMLEKIRQDQLKEAELEKKRKCRRECYRLAIMNQMSDKEMERRRMEELNRQETFQFLESEKKREANIKAVINLKLEAMKQACLPEKYVKEIEAQLNRLKNTKRKITQ